VHVCACSRVHTFTASKERILKTGEGKHLFNLCASVHMCATAHLEHPLKTEHSDQMPCKGDFISRNQGQIEPRASQTRKQCWRSNGDQPPRKTSLPECSTNFDGCKNLSFKYLTPWALRHTIRATLRPAGCFTLARQEFFHDLSRKPYLFIWRPESVG